MRGRGGCVILIHSLFGPERLSQVTGINNQAQSERDGRHVAPASGEPSCPLPWFPVPLRLGQGCSCVRDIRHQARTY